MTWAAVSAFMALGLISRNSAETAYDLESVLEMAEQVLARWTFEYMVVIRQSSDFDDGHFDLVRGPLLSGKSKILPTGEGLLRTLASLEGDSVMVISLSTLSSRELFDLSESGYLQRFSWYMPKIDFGSRIRLRLDSKVFTFERGSGNSIEIFEHYSVKGPPLRSQFVASWRIPTKTLLVLQSELYERRRNLTGVTLVNTILPWPPIIAMDVDGEGRPSNPSGLMHGIYELVRQVLNFKTEFVSPTDRSWGSRSANGSYNGMMGMLQRGKADICTSGLSVTLERADAVDFGYVLHNYEVGVVVRRKVGSGGLSVNYWVYIDVFVRDVWVAMAASLLTLAVGFFCIGLLHDRKDERVHYHLVGVAAIFLHRNSTILPQDKLLSSRLLYLTNCLAAFLVVAFYSAVLTSWMTAVEPPMSIKSFANLRDQGYDLYYWKDTSVEAYLKNNLPKGSPGHQLHLAAAERKQYVESSGEAIKLLEAKEGAAYFDYLLSVFGVDYVDTALIEESIKEDASFAFQKDSEFTDLFSYHLEKLKAHGMLAKNAQKWLSLDRPAISPNSEEESVKPLGYEEAFFFPFALLAAGICAALAAVLLRKAGA